MSTPRYIWAYSHHQREEILACARTTPAVHSPPHRPIKDHLQFLVSAACYDTLINIGLSRSAGTAFCTLLELLQQHTARTVAWCACQPLSRWWKREILKLLHERVAPRRTSHRLERRREHSRTASLHRATERFILRKRHFFALSTTFTTTRCIMVTSALTDGRWSSAAEYLNRWGARKRTGVEGISIRDYGRSGMKLGCSV